MFTFIISAWTLIFYQPLYNALIGLVSVIPFHDIGFAIIILTLIVKLILYPVTQRSILGQLKLKELEGEINTIKESGASKEEIAKQTFALYKTHKVNPFSSCLLIIIQMPILIALYLVFFHGLPSTSVTLYSFIHLPDTIHMEFLGIFDLAEKSIVLALAAGFTQFLQVHLSPVSMTSGAKSANANDFKSNLARSMQMQMKYILPIFIVFISYRFSAALALYWTINNIFTILQELLIKRRLKRIALSPTVLAK